MAAQSAKFEAWQVHLAKDAHWHADFLSEMLAFPNGRHDDQVDSVSRFYLTSAAERLDADAGSDRCAICLLAKLTIPLGEWLRHHGARRAECALKLLWVFGDARVSEWRVTAWYGSPN